jgi:hypothetical protein
LRKNNVGKICISRFDTSQIALSAFFCEKIRFMIEDAIKKQILD